MTREQLLEIIETAYRQGFKDAGKLLMETGDKMEAPKLRECFKDLQTNNTGKDNG